MLGPKVGEVMSIIIILRIKCSKIITVNSILKFESNCPHSTWDRGSNNNINNNIVNNSENINTL